MTYLFFLGIVLFATGCFRSPLPRKNKWQVTLKKDDKDPYGTYLAYRSLKTYFPYASIDSLPSWYHYDKIDYSMMNRNNEPSLLILIGLDFYVSDEELAHLLQFAAAGNEIILFGSNFDGKIEQQFYCYKALGGTEEFPLTIYNQGKENINALSLYTHPQITYGYNGRALQSYFAIARDSTMKDSTTYSYNKNYVNTVNITISTIPDSLGMTKGGSNFLRYNIGAGHITVHASPLVLSNYFLLQQNNIQYMDGIWQTLPTNITKIYWNEYFKRSPGTSDFGVLLRYPAMRWALLLAIVTILVYVLFEGKRRQRIIPIIPPVTNTSVSFVETVGRLYYNKGGHTNMAEKMIQHFLEWVRTKYYINTNELNDDFIKLLAVKSGKPESQVRFLIDSIHELRLGNTVIDDAYLFQLYNNIHEFYKNN